jgi:hypothetical protein
MAPSGEIVSNSKVVKQLKEFIAGADIKTLSELVELKNSGMYAVVACFDSVVEGVDMWLEDLPDIKKSRCYFNNFASILSDLLFYFF